MSDNELGLFLRSRREAMTPAEAGLPPGSRRRTPGLRRSELAMLAGISVEYLARLEQGRDRHPSPQVLAALADALRLTTDERLTLLHAEKLTTGTGQLCPGAGLPPARVARPTVRALLDRLEPTPAVLLNRLSEVIAYTTGYEQLVGPLGVLEAPVPSLARYLFTDPRARAAHPEWDLTADEQITRLKADSIPDDPHLADLVQELTLTAGAPFGDRWSTGSRMSRHPGVQRLTHPEAGELRLARETLTLPDADGQRLLVHLPADDATAAALDSLTGRRPGALRAVAG
ncbi:helix-turn-helix transcriptional regulator [Streptomyces sp. AK02-01A]|uniref:helix-turn-helix domain-containing protein n=1 Tax=Streptomyces sp. AK02-01A TaxID=3028648 RepID=UPI0029BA3176|nr:helix-turn-helix transcriptional regulator [Streptomyces sp. AK02-01A]MDX3851694.1 helix-turn-helix transcriptional regulator [Streptomyces sp. AK02-01A]